MQKILKNKLFTTVFLSDIVSNLGDTIYYLALMNYILLIPESKLGIAILNLTEIIPIFSNFIIGYIADKTKKKLQHIYFTQIIRTILYLFLGFAMGFKPELWIVVFACIVNFISDISGLYENGLYTQISKNIIEKNDRESTMAFKQSISQILDIVFKSLGAILITVISYQNLAFLNASTFLISFLIIRSISKELTAKITKDKPASDTKNSKLDNPTFSVKNIWMALKDTINYLFTLNEIKTSLIILPFINSALAITMPLVLLLMINDHNLLIINQQNTISLLAISTTIGSIAGGLLTIKLFKNVSISKLVKVLVSFLILLFIGMYFHQIYLILLCNIVINIAISSLNPKLGSLIFNNADENKLATILGGMSTYFTTGDIITKSIFSMLIIKLKVQIIITIFMIISILLGIFTFFSYSIQTSKQNCSKK